MLSLSEVKNVLVTLFGTKTFVFRSYKGFFYRVLNSEGLLKEVSLYVYVYVRSIVLSKLLFT